MSLMFYPKMVYPLSEGNSFSANQSIFGVLENIYCLKKIISPIQSFYLIQGMMPFALPPFNVMLRFSEVLQKPLLLFWSLIKNNIIITLTLSQGKIKGIIFPLSAAFTWLVVLLT